MILAVHAMSADAQVVCYGIAIVAFILAAVGGVASRWNPPGLLFIGLGLAAYAFPTFWNTLAVT